MNEVCPHEKAHERLWGTVGCLVLAGACLALLNYFNYDLGIAGTLIAVLGIVQAPLILHALFRRDE